MKRLITTTETGSDGATGEAEKRNKGVIFKDCAQFTDCISKINSTQLDNAKDVDVPLLVYNNNYLKTSKSLLQY